MVLEQETISVRIYLLAYSAALCSKDSKNTCVVDEKNTGRPQVSKIRCCRYNDEYIQYEISSRLQRQDMVDGRQR